MNRRSTVATVTEIYDYLRLLMARLGSPHCYRCGREIKQQAAEQIQDRLMEMPEGTKVMIMAPMVRGRKGAHKDVFVRIRKAGFVRRESTVPSLIWRTYPNWRRERSIISTPSSTVSLFVLGSTLVSASRYDLRSTTEKGWWSHAI